MKILFVGDLELSKIVAAPSKVGFELFKKVSNQYSSTKFYLYFQDGKKYSRIQKLIGKKNIKKNMTQMGLITFIVNVIKFRPQIVQIISPSVYYLLAFPIFRLLGTKLFYLVHNVNKHTLKYYASIKQYEKMRALWIEKMSILNSNYIQVLSKREKQLLIDGYNISSQKIIIVSNGINSFATKKKYIKNSSKIIKIITVGSLDRKEKGIDLLIDFLCEIDIPVELKVCNYKEHSNEKNQTPAKIDIEWIEPLGENELRKEFLKNDLYITFSRYESFGIALLEAMNVGMIFLSANQIGLTERFNQLLTQKCVVNLDIKGEVFEKFNNLISLSPYEKQDLSNKIVEFSNKFSWNKVVLDYFNIYDDIFTTK